MDSEDLGLDAQGKEKLAKLVKISAERARRRPGVRKLLLDLTDTIDALQSAGKQSQAFRDAAAVSSLPNEEENLAVGQENWSSATIQIRNTELAVQGMMTIRDRVLEEVQDQSALDGVVGALQKKFFKKSD